MGIMTLAEFRTRIKNGIQRQNIGDADCDLFLNSVLREIGYAYRFRELEGTASFSTVVGSVGYQIGAGQAINISDFRKLHDDGLYIFFPYEYQGVLIKETRTAYRKKSSPFVVEARGLPRYYHKSMNVVYLRPTPDSIVSINLVYWKKITPLSGINDVTPFDEEWDNIFLIGAMAEGRRGFGEMDHYVALRNDFLNMVRTRTIEEEVEEFPEGGIQIATSEDDLVRE